MANEEKTSNNNGLNIFKNPEELLFKYRHLLTLFLIGVILMGIGVFVYKNNFSDDQVEVINTEEQSVGGEIIVEIAGEIQNPGVYKLTDSSRVEDLIVVSGGVTANADKNWMSKSLNRAAKLSDGQKIYILSVDEQSNVLSASENGGYQNISPDFSTQGSGLININMASQKELESLSGIGPVYGQNIIEQRPYSNIQELLTKDVIPNNTYEKIKDEITI